MTADICQDLRLNCRKIFLRNHVVPVRIGVHEHEKEGSQRIIFNVELYVPLTHSTPQADRLTEVVDYDFVRELIARRVQRGHIELQETLCDDLADELIRHPHVRALRLSTCKPDVYPDCEGVGVEVFRFKEAQP